MATIFFKFTKDEAGVTAIEYGLIAGLITLGIISSIRLIGLTISTQFYGPLAGAFS